MATKPFTVRVVEEYADGFQWKGVTDHNATTHDVALKRAVRYNATLDRRGLVEAHGALVTITATVVPHGRMLP